MTATPPPAMAASDLTGFREAPVRSIARWRPYPAYKPSGVEWLGDISAHWEAKRLKFGVNLINEKTDSFDREQTYIGLENIESWTGRLVNHGGEFSPEGVSNSFKCDDVLFGKLRPYLAKVLHAQTGGICTSELLVLRPKDFDSHFLFYYLLAPDFIKAVDSSTYGSKMPRANWEFIGNLPVLLPPLDEQRAIAAFLDRETTRLDALIARKQRLIELLHEKRTALISQAVTRGLDPHVAMKDSGVEWLGEIPAHWEVARAKQVSDVFIPQRNKPDLNSDTGLPWITMEDIARPSVDGSIATRFVTQSAAREAGSKPLPTGSVIASCVGNLGIASVNTEPVIINQQLQAYLPKRINGWFLRYLVGISQPYFEIAANATTLSYVNREGFGELPVVVPESNEQTAIVFYLDEATKKIDLLIAKVKDAIERLREYRTALIAAAVTGKIDVRGGEDLSGFQATLNPRS
jgi:type I restriction enzyme, S subunit